MGCSVFALRATQMSKLQTSDSWNELAPHFITQVNLALENFLDSEEKVRKCVLLHNITFRPARSARCAATFSSCIEKTRIGRLGNSVLSNSMSVNPSLPPSERSYNGEIWQKSACGGEALLDICGFAADDKTRFLINQLGKALTHDRMVIY
jgi:hypothetical protein